jgi:RNA polymerase sigma-70 factor (ECF subfamily)
MVVAADNLLARLRNGGSRADWARFVDLYGPLLARWARHLLPAKEIPDLVEDIFVLVMEKLPSWSGTGDRSFRGWLRAMLLNRCRDLARRAATRPVVADPAALEAVAADDAFGEVMAAEERDLLARRALRIMQTDFEPTTWRACWECVAQGRPAAEVAAELGVRVDVVYSACYRVLKRLRSEFGALK